MKNVIEEKILQANISRSLIYRLFAFCNVNEPIKLKEIVKLSRLPIDLIKRILKHLDIIFESPETLSEFIRIKKDMREVFQDICQSHNIFRSNLNQYNWFSTDSDTNNRSTDLMQMLSAPFKAKRALDQFLVNIDTLIRRSMFLYQDINLNPVKIVFLGDDDCTSIALAHLLQQIPAKDSIQNWEIVVIDIDQELLDYIQTIATKNHFTIKLYRQDLLQELTPDLKKLFGSFDIVFTDPPYTVNGMALFLYKAMELLKHPSGLIYACFGYSIQEYTMGMKFQELLNQMGLYIQNVYENFNIYEGAFSIGATSGLYKLQPTKKWDQISLPISEGSIYTGDNAKVPREIIRSK